MSPPSLLTPQRWPLTTCVLLERFLPSSFCLVCQCFCLLCVYCFGPKTSCKWLFHLNYLSNVFGSLFEPLSKTTVRKSATFFFSGSLIVFHLPQWRLIRSGIRLVGWDENAWNYYYYYYCAVVFLVADTFQLLDSQSCIQSSCKSLCCSAIRHLALKSHNHKCMMSAYSCWHWFCPLSMFTFLNDWNP